MDGVSGRIVGLEVETSQAVREGSVQVRGVELQAVDRAVAVVTNVEALCGK